MTNKKLVEEYDSAPISKRKMDSFVDDYLKQMCVNGKRLKFSECVKAFAYPFGVTSVPTVCYAYTCLMLQGGNPALILVIGGAMAAGYAVLTLRYYFTQSISASKPLPKLPIMPQTPKTQKSIILYS